MSCNLRSTRHITDGQCMTTKPVVEAVCADRCLVYDSGALFNQRQRSSPMNIKQDHNVSAREQQQVRRHCGPRSLSINIIHYPVVRSLELVFCVYVHSSGRRLWKNTGAKKLLFRTPKTRSGTVFQDFFFLLQQIYVHDNHINIYIYAC